MEIESNLQSTDAVQPGGIGHAISWLGGGTILPCISVSFYQAVVRRKISQAVVFLIVFGLALGLLSTLGVGRALFSVGDQIQQSYARGDLPTITIRGGQAQVSGVQPNVLIDRGGEAVIIDTTGNITTLDPARYRQGILLTRSQLIVINPQNQVESIPLARLNQVFKMDPIVLDGENVTRLWQQFSTILVTGYLVGALFWNTLVRLGYLAVLALLVWGAVRLFQPRASYGPVFILGIYAFVPALYLNLLLNAIHIQFFTLQTLILLAVWVLVLILTYRRSRKEAEPPDPQLVIWTWRTWVGMPMLALFALNAIFSWPSGAMILWIAAVVTLIVLVLVELIGTLKSEAPKVV